MDNLQKAKLLIQNKKYIEAEELLCLYSPDEMTSEIKGLLGLCFFETGDLNLAQDYLIDSVVEHFDKKFAEILEKILVQTKNYDGLLGLKIMLLEQNPDNILLLREITQIAQNNNKYDIALEYFNILINLCPDDYVALNNLGLVYEALNEFEKAEECYKKSLLIKDYFNTNFNLGVLLRKTHKFEESVKFLQKAVKMNPDFPKVKYSLAMSYLMLKDFQKGYPLFAEHFTDLMKKVYKNEWNGEKHPDSSICVYATGGLGDMIMYSRYIDYLKDYFKKIYVRLPQTLHNVFKQSFPYIETIDLDSQFQDYDYSITFIHLPQIFHIDFNQYVPKTQNLFTPNYTLTEKFKKELFQTDKIKIGINWHGTQNGTRTFTNRSIPIEALEPVFSKFQDNAVFYSIQKDLAHTDCEKYPFIVDLYDKINDFNDTLSVLKNLDFLITIDSSPVHAAGAVGVKTFLLLPYANEWRWFDKGNRTIWYDSVEIFRQDKEGDWASAVSKLINAI